MSRVFVDTSAWYAMATPDDFVHESAVDLLREHQGRLTTNDHVLMETWVLACGRRNRAAADEMVGGDSEPQRRRNPYSYP